MQHGDLLEEHKKQKGPEWLGYLQKITTIAKAPYRGGKKQTNKKRIRTSTKAYHTCKAKTLNAKPFCCH